MDDEFFGFGLGEVRKKFRFPRDKAVRVAKKVERRLGPLVEAALRAGSLRRLRPEVADVEFVVLPRDVEEFDAAMREAGYSAGPGMRIYRSVADGIPVELYVAHAPEEMGAMFLAYTGDYLFNISMRSQAKRMGYKLDQYGIWKDGKAALQSPDEREFFDFLGFDWHAPEQRSLARRAELRDMIRDLLKKRLPRKDEDFVGVAAEILRTKKWIEPPLEAKIERLHAKHVSRRGRRGPTMGAEELVEMGDPDPPDGLRDESSRPPGDQLYPGVLWDFVEWREPDLREPGRMVWYGPDGPEGDVATEVEVQPDGYVVCEYQPVEGLIEDAPSPILKTCRWIGFGLVSDAFEFHGPGRVPTDELAANPEAYARWAASVGVTHLAYWGGDEEWLEALPR